MEYMPTIGLEIHAELSTASKIFCSCPVAFDGEANTRCCPICIGLPGTLPLLNEKALEYIIKAGLALNCEINEFSRFDRKNYFYPDLPKAYQISQFDLPFCKNGFMEIDSSTGKKKIGIERIHLEEDAGKLVHDSSEKYTLADFNRCGIPLIEIVTRPELDSTQEVKDFFEKVRRVLLFAGVSDCRMEKGNLRCDVNLSVRPANTKDLGTRTEMKNLNSIRSIVQAIEHETQRQITLLKKGARIVQETRRWDDSRGESYPIRSKEDVHDYRYFPEPDMMPVVLTKQKIAEIKATLPKLPDERFLTYTQTFGLSSLDANLILSSKVLSDFYEAAVFENKSPKMTASYITVELLRGLNLHRLEPEEIPFTAGAFGRLVKMHENGEITANNAKKTLGEMFETGEDPQVIAVKRGYSMMSNLEDIEKVVFEVLEKHPQAVMEFLAGKNKTFGFLMGQCSRALSGRADPKLLKETLIQYLTKMKEGSRTDNPN